MHPLLLISNFNGPHGTTNFNNIRRRHAQRFSKCKNEISLMVSEYPSTRSKPMISIWCLINVTFNLIQNWWFPTNFFKDRNFRLMNSDSKKL
jgi:hypothetical protein